MRKFLFSMFCATLSFLLALAPSAQAQSKSDAEALKKAKDAEEAAKKEAAKRAKEAEKAAKKAREQEEAARKAERAEAEQKARARDEALRRARAAAAAARKTESKEASKTAVATDITGSKVNEDAVAGNVSAAETEKRTKAVAEARRAAELARDAAKKAEAQESARKAKEAEEAAKHEAAVRAAQEKDAALSAKKSAEQLRKMNQQQEAERKAKELELARKAKAEKEAAQKARAEEAARQARADAEARKAKAAEEAANREIKKEAARREKAQQAATRSEELAKAKASSEATRAAVPNTAGVSYEGETFRIVKVDKAGSASVVAPSQAPAASRIDAAAQKGAIETKSKAEAEERSLQAKRQEEGRLKAEAARKNQAAESNRKSQEQPPAPVTAKSAPVSAPSSSQTVTSARSSSPIAPVGRASGANMVSPSQPEPIGVPAALPRRVEHSIGEQVAAAELRARREVPSERAPIYSTAPDAGKRSGNSQARYYEELWEKELASRNGKRTQAQPVLAAAPDDRRAQARYYEELWRKEQEAKAAKSATQTAKIRAESEVAVRKAANVEVQKVEEKKQELSVRTQPAVTPKVKAAVVPPKSKPTVVSPRPEPVIAAPTPRVSAVATKDAELKAEKARLNASIEASRKTPEAKTFRPVQFTPKPNQEALKQAEEDARKVRAQEEAARRSLEEAAAKKAKEEREAIAQAEEDARKARAQEEAARKSLEQAAAKKAKEEREAMAQAEKEAAKKAKAEDAARRAAEQDAAKRSREERRSSPVVTAQVQAEPAQKEGFWSRFRSTEKSGTPAPDVSALLSEEERSAQDRALEALRQKQAELDAQDVQLKGGAAAPAVSAQPQPSPAPVTIVRPTTAVPAISAEDAAKEARALAASNAELQSLKKKLATASAEREKVATEIQTAEKELSTPGAVKSSGKRFEVIVDNNDARLVGTWAQGKTGGFYGKDYSFKGKGTGANYADFTPNLSAAGTYEVFEWHVAGANRAADAPYIVNFDGGSQVVSVNQQLNGGKWNSIGTFSFAAGQNGSVRITDGIGLQGQMVMADAIRFVLADGSAKGSKTVDTSAREKAIEALRIKQDALTDEEGRLRTQIQAAEKRIAALNSAAARRTTSTSTQAATVEQSPITTATSEAEIQARAAEALSRREAELNAATPKASKTRKSLSVKTTPPPAAVQEPSRPLTEKEQKLADLLRRYKADEITPRDYHQERAKILAE